MSYSSCFDAFTIMCIHVFLQYSDILACLNAHDDLYFNFKFLLFHTLNRKYSCSIIDGWRCC